MVSITNMKKKIVLFALSLLLVIAGFAYLKKLNEGPKIGEMAPEIVLKNTDGKVVKLSDYKGKMVLIDFWASWCAQCRKESPRLVKTYAKFKNAEFSDGAQGFEIVSVSLDKDRQEWLDAIKNDGYSWVNVSDLKYWDSDPAKLYEVSSIPTNYLVDSKGKIIEKNLRGNMLDITLQSLRK